MLAAIACLAATGCRSREPAGDGGVVALERRAPRHVILITVDTLRADHMSAYGYRRSTTPELDRRASQGVLFERAIAQWPKTGTSFASIFTGRYPQTTGLTHKAAIRIPESYFTLPELFAELGFTTLAVVSNGVLSDELGWSAGFERYLETWGDSTTEVPEEYRKLLNAPRVSELALPLLEEHATEEYLSPESSGRLFVWLHYSDPHAPYIQPEDFPNPFLADRYYHTEEIVDLTGTRGKAIGNHRELEFYVAQYDANVLVVDRYVSQLLEQLERWGLLEDTLLIFTADHGESLGEHGSYFEHGPLPYNTTLHVPLFFVDRGSLPPGRRVAEPVELIDLYPTLLELLAPGRVVEELEGKSLLAALRGEPSLAQAAAPALAFGEAGRLPRHFRSVQERDWKLVYRAPRPGQSEGEHNWELYDLRVDPGETRNLAGEHVAELARLRRELLAWMREAPESTASGELSAEARRALKALGYVESEGE